MSKAKPFHREKAKSLLENLVVDAVQSYFEQESEKANLKNKSKIKISKENPKFEGFLRMFESIRVKLRKNSIKIF